jgi:hypothetical protein
MATPWSRFATASPFSFAFRVSSTKCFARRAADTVRCVSVLLCVPNAASSLLLRLFFFVKTRNPVQTPSPAFWLVDL